MNDTIVRPGSKIADLLLTADELVQQATDLGHEPACLRVTTGRVEMTFSPTAQHVLVDLALDLRLVALCDPFGQTLSPLSRIAGRLGNVEVQLCSGPPA